MHALRTGVQDSWELMIDDRLISNDSLIFGKAFGYLCVT